MDFNTTYEMVIGLEIHAQLNTRTKLFSPDSTHFTEGENDQVHPVSLALPGTLPVLNKQALKLALKTAKAFKGHIQNNSVFSRKNYFYPDLPKAYQISQYDKPFCSGGFVSFVLKDKTYTVPLERIHLEEDAGRSLHRGSYSLINFNRAGVPLIEIVTKPSLRSPFEASQCVRAIRRTLKYLDVCNGNLEEGSLRCDCNISIRKKGDTAYGTRVELKNINSFRFIEKSLLYEAHRQIECLNSGLSIKQETRLYDSAKNQTLAMRSKEEASDYRYFPDPDLLPVNLDSDILKDLDLVELPFEKSLRFIKEYKLKASVVDILIEDQALANYFETVVKKINQAQTVSHWLTGDMQAQLKGKDFASCPISASEFASLLQFVFSGDISNSMAKEIFLDMWTTGQSAKSIIQKKNLKQISSDQDLEKLVEQVLKDYPKQLKDYQAGRTKLFGFFIGQIMKITKGQANPQKLSKILTQKLEKLCAT